MVVCLISDSESKLYTFIFNDIGLHEFDSPDEPGSLAVVFGHFLVTVKNDHRF